jgi:outer membrane protein
MKTLFAKSLVAASVLFMAVGASAQAEGLKIGYFSFERVTRESAPAMAAQARLEGEFKARDQELKDQAVKFQQAAQKFEKDMPTLSTAERERRGRGLDEQRFDLETKRQKYMEAVSIRRNEEMATVSERTSKVIKQIVDAEKYDLILSDAAYVSPRVDITQKVIDALNAGK